MTFEPGGDHSTEARAGTIALATLAVMAAALFLIGYGIWSLFQ
jgi:hypothetical protein